MTVPLLTLLLSATMFILLLSSIRRFGHPIAGWIFCTAALLMTARRLTALAYRAGLTSFDELDTVWLPFAISLLFVGGVAMARSETESRRMDPPF